MAICRSGTCLGYRRQCDRLGVGHQLVGDLASVAGILSGLVHLGGRDGEWPALAWGISGRD